MGAADDWWITLPPNRRDQIYRWVTQRRDRRKPRRGRRPGLPPSQPDLFDPPA